MSELKKFLEIIEIPKKKIDKIVKKHNVSLENFLSNTSKWSKIGLDEQDVNKLLKWKRVFNNGGDHLDRIQSDATSAHDELQHQEVELFGERYQNEIDSGIKEAKQAKLNEIARANELACQTHQKKTKRLEVANRISFTVAGGIIGTFILPGIGTAIGTILGSIIGFSFSVAILRPILRKILKDMRLDPKYLEKKANEDLYDQALNKLNANRNTNKKQLKELMKLYRLSNHPDKQNAEYKEKGAQKFIELELCYEIVKRYRKEKGQW